MLEIIRKVIYEWDPIGLTEFSPSDEYDAECDSILNEFSEEQDDLGLVIYNVFTDNFSDAFQESLCNCVVIAKTIIEKINNL